MKGRLLKSVIGVTLASIGIACTLNCGLGAFSMTLAYKSLSLLIGVPLAIINIGCDFIMLLIAKRINKEKKNYRNYNYNNYDLWFYINKYIP